MISVTLSIPNWSSAVSCSTVIQSVQATLFFFIWCIAALTPDFNMLGPSIVIEINGFSFLLSSNNSSMYCDHLSRISFFSIIEIPSVTLMPPEDEHVLEAVKSLSFCLCRWDLFVGLSRSFHTFL